MTCRIIFLFLWQSFVIQHLSSFVILLQNFKVTFTLKLCNNIWNFNIWRGLIFSVRQGLWSLNPALTAALKKVKPTRIDALVTDKMETFWITDHDVSLSRYPIYSTPVEQATGTADSMHSPGSRILDIAAGQYRNFRPFTAHHTRHTRPWIQLCTDYFKSTEVHSHSELPERGGAKGKGQRVPYYCRLSAHFDSIEPILSAL